MVKTLLILFNFIGFLLFNLFFLEQVNISQTLPERIAPGESVDVTATVSKGKIQGFAKLQLNVAEGLTIEPINNNGASFTFSDQKAKFIWMSLPEDKSFEIKYRLVAAAGTSGPKEISGHFSYIDENKRLVHDLQPTTIQTDPSLEPATTDTDDPNNTKALAQVFREVEPLANGRKQVTLHIQKTDLSGFAKLQETIAQDYTAAAIQTEESVFNVVNNQIKFVWFDIPQEANIAVSYELIPVVDEPNYVPSDDGEFSFLVNNETKTVNIEAYSADIAPLADLEQPETNEQPEEVSIQSAFEEEEATTEETDDWEEEDADMEPTIESDMATEPVVEVNEAENWKSGSFDGEDDADIAPEEQQPEKETEVADDIPKEAPQETTTTQTKTPASPAASSQEVAISYRVQITAANKLVDEAYFEATHKYSGPFAVEHHEGWIKYTTGAFDLYRIARDHRNQLTQQYDFPGPFVTAYNAGDRITVQEALMIANQKWVP